MWARNDSHLEPLTRVRDVDSGLSFQRRGGQRGGAGRQTARKPAFGPAFETIRWSRHPDLNRGPAVYECGRSPSVGDSCGPPRQARRTSNPLRASGSHQGTGPQGSAQGSGAAAKTFTSALVISITKALLVANPKTVRKAVSRPLRTPGRHCPGSGAAARCSCGAQARRGRPSRPSPGGGRSTGAPGSRRVPRA